MIVRREMSLRRLIQRRGVADTPPALWTARSLLVAPWCFLFVSRRFRRWGREIAEEESARHVKYASAFIPFDAERS